MMPSEQSSINLTVPPPRYDPDPCFENAATIFVILISIFVILIYTFLYKRFVEKINGVYWIGTFFILVCLVIFRIIIYQIPGSNPLTDILIIPYAIIVKIFGCRLRI